jgi:hypothetical protein
MPLFQDLKESQEINHQDAGGKQNDPCKGLKSNV